MKTRVLAAFLFTVLFLLPEILLPENNRIRVVLRYRGQTGVRWYFFSDSGNPNRFRIYREG
jgi:hypothetical protein